MRDKTMTIYFRLIPKLRAALDRAAQDMGQTRSALVKELVVAGLTKRGYWPPTTATEEAA